MMIVISMIHKTNSRIYRISSSAPFHQPKPAWESSPLYYV